MNNFLNTQCDFHSYSETKVEQWCASLRGTSRLFLSGGRGFQISRTFLQLHPAVHDTVATDMMHLEVDRVGNVPSVTCSSLDSQQNNPSGPEMQCLPGSVGAHSPIANLKCQHVIPEYYLGRDVLCITGSHLIATVNNFQSTYNGKRGSRSIF